MYNGSQEWDAVIEFKDLVSEADRFGDWIVNFKYILVDVDQYSEGELLRISNAKGKLPSEKLELIYEWLKEVLLARFPLEEGMRIIESMKEGKAMTYAIERLFDDIEEKGIEKGREEGIAKIAGIVENAIKKGMKLDDIVELTGLTVEDVERIREKMHE